MEAARSDLRERNAMLRWAVSDGSCKRVIKQMGRAVLAAQHAYNEARRRHLDEEAEALAAKGARRQAKARTRPSYMSRICAESVFDWASDVSEAPCFLDRIWA